MEETIEEFASDLCKEFNKDEDDNYYWLSMDSARLIVKGLIAKGYRKESDTAREILAEAKKWVKAHYKDKVTDSFGEREILFMEAFGCLFEYLKEKYEVK